MATRNFKVASMGTNPQRAGFLSFVALVRRLDEETTRQIAVAGWDGGDDPREYVELCSLIEDSIRTNILGTDPGQREGYLRALADFLCITADGCSLGLEEMESTWDPLAVTEKSFASKRGEAAYAA